METVKFYGLLLTALFIVAVGLELLGIDDKAIGYSVASAGVVYGLCRRD